MKQLGRMTYTRETVQGQIEMKILLDTTNISSGTSPRISLIKLFLYDNDIEDFEKLSFEDKVKNSIFITMNESNCNDLINRLNEAIARIETISTMEIANTVVIKDKKKFLDGLIKPMLN